MSRLLAELAILLAAASAAAALLWPASPRRSAAMLVALVLIPTLIIGEQWHSSAITHLRRHLLEAAAFGLIGLAVVAALGGLFDRRPFLLPWAIVAALPFRIPLQAGAKEANLLVPLYLVIAAGVLAHVLRTRPGVGSRSGERLGGAGRLLGILLAATVVLYAVQSLYSEDFPRAVQNTAFFYVPFALAFVLMRDQSWDRRLLIGAIAVVVGEALVFALIAFWEYAARHLLWNPQLIRSNAFHPYFRVNSLFWDSNIFGRYMTLAITAILAVLLWAGRRLSLLLALALGIIWLGLLTTFSQTSFVALLAGLATLAALRWSLRLTVLVCVAAVGGAAAFVLAAGSSLQLNLSSQATVNGETSGRANLIRGGLRLFGDRPLWGYGSGSFGRAFVRHEARGPAPVTLSHTAPVTVAAEQGLIGLGLYLALLIAGFTTLLRGMRSLMPGLGARSPPADREGSALIVARAAVLGCVVVLVTHTIAYASFLEDPATWVLLSIGAALSAHTVAARHRADLDRDGLPSRAIPSAA